MITALHLLRGALFALVTAQTIVGQALADGIVPGGVLDGWHSMAKITETLQVTVQHSGAEGKPAEQYTCSLQGNVAKCERLGDGVSNTLKRVYLYNKRGFTLMQSSDGRWRLGGVTDRGETWSLLNNWLSHARSGYSAIPERMLWEIIDHPDWRVIAWKPPENGADQAELLVEYYLREEARKAQARFVLQPSKRYRILSAIWREDTDPEPAIWVCEYKDDSLLTEVVPSAYYLKGGGPSWQLTSISNRTLPESEFSLSHYGLPEFVEPRQGTNWWLWAFLLALVVTIGVFGCTRAKA